MLPSGPNCPLLTLPSPPSSIILLQWRAAPSARPLSSRRAAPASSTTSSTTGAGQSRVGGEDWYPLRRRALQVHPSAVNGGHRQRGGMRREPRPSADLTRTTSLSSQPTRTAPRTTRWGGRGQGERRGGGGMPPLPSPPSSGLHGASRDTRGGALARRHGALRCRQGEGGGEEGEVCVCGLDPDLPPPHSSTACTSSAASGASRGARAATRSSGQRRLQTLTRTSRRRTCGRWEGGGGVCSMTGRGEIVGPAAGERMRTRGRSTMGVRERNRRAPASCRRCRRPLLRLQRPPPSPRPSPSCASRLSRPSTS